MKLLFKQRFFSWFDSYDIYDETGATVYTVEGKLSFGHHLEVHDAMGNAIGNLQEKVFTLLPKFEIYLEDTYVKDDCIRIINSFLFVAIFCCLMSLIAVLAKKLEPRIYFNIYPVVDHTAGGLLGILEALMLLCLLCIFLRLLFVTASDTMLVLNEETILKSRLFRYIYQLSGKL